MVEEIGVSLLGYKKKVNNRKIPVKPRLRGFTIGYAPE